MSRSLILLLALGCRSADKATTDTGTIQTLTTAVDADGDGFTSAEDCNDADPATSPGATEVCDGIDNNCDGSIDEGVTSELYADVDEDGYGDESNTIETCGATAGYVAVAGDCDDAEASVNPGAAELCDGTDNDCDSEIDEDDTATWYADVDGDGYGDPDEPTEDCAQPTGYVDDATDCDDADAGVSPESKETCDEIDNDCDGQIDEDVTTSYYLDADNDGYGLLDDVVQACEQPDGYAEEAGDCDDADNDFHPGADESDCADESDYNCDGSVGYADNDADGYPACEECDDSDAAVSPAASEICDGVDNDCDGDTDDADSGVDLSTASTWYADDDGDGYGDPDDDTLACDQPSDAVADDTDCDDTDAATNPGAAEVCNSIDDDCDGLIDDADSDVDLSTAGTWYADDDGDGDGDPDADTLACDQPSGAVEDDTDCDDADSGVNPDATEVCDDTDNDCDGDTDDADSDLDTSTASTWYDDDDGDGYGDSQGPTTTCDQPSNTVSDDTDCDDADGAINPAAAEVCGGGDEDCDGLIDEDDPGLTDAQTWYIDYDGDGYGSTDYTAATCTVPSGYVSDTGDCDDADSDVNPDAAEVCNSTDDDCDGLTDDDDADLDTSTTSAGYADDDGDGYGDAADVVWACALPTGYVTDDTDCDDTAADLNPGETEICDTLDNDCDGDIDESDATDASVWYTDDDGDGYGDPDADTLACDQPSGAVEDDTDCDDADSGVNPDATEVCDTLDNDCDGETDESDAADASVWYTDADGDGYGDPDEDVAACDQPSDAIADATDCDDDDPDSNPGATEVCDGADNDCDGDIDEGVEITWYLDYDGDGYGDDDYTDEACEAPTALYVVDGGDCDDGESLIYPGAAEGCDGTDYDCDGDVDNDADGDGYADATCGGDDCDDADATTLPEQGGGCALGTTCLDILDIGRSSGDGVYTIDPDGYSAGVDPFDVTCDMTTDGGGWTEIPYASDLAFQRQFTTGDVVQALPSDFSLELGDAEISAVQALSTEGSQAYVGLCEHVIHYYYNDGGSYTYAFGFIFLDGITTTNGASTYTPHDITVSQDGCAGNGGEGGDPSLATIFEINSPLVPVVNVISYDSGDASESFGSPLTENPAWLR